MPQMLASITVFEGAPCVLIRSCISPCGVPGELVPSFLRPTGRTQV